MNKKGVELSMNVIIIAAIGLLVLVILAVLVINSSTKFQTGATKNCNTLGGLCKPTCDTGATIPEGQGSCGTNQCCKVFTAG